MASIHDTHSDWKDGSMQQRLPDGNNKQFEENCMADVNYIEELKRLESLEASGGDSPFLKLGAGQHKIKFLGELSAPVERDFPAENKKIKQSDVKVEFEGNPKTWSVPLSKSGVYAQLIKYAAKNGGLTNKTLTIAVQKQPGKDGKQRNTYMILEAIGL